MKLIVVSGWATPLDALAGFIKNLSRVFQIQAYALSDLLNNSLSSSDNSSESNMPALSEFARGLVKILNAESEPCWVAGFSMGGMIALETACREQKKISGLILAGATPSFCMREEFVHGKPVENVRALSLNLFKDARRALSRFYEQVSFPFRPMPEKEQVWLDLVMKEDVKMLERGLQYLMKTDLRNIVSEVRVPALLIHGKQDKVVPWQASEWLAERMSKARLKLLVDYGHDLILRSSSWLPAELNDFIGVSK